MRVHASKLQLLLLLSALCFSATASSNHGTKEEQQQQNIRKMQFSEEEDLMMENPVEEESESVEESVVSDTAPYSLAMKAIADCDLGLGLSEDAVVEGAYFSHQGVGTLDNITTAVGYCGWWQAVTSGPLNEFSVDVLGIAYDETRNTIQYTATVTVTNSGPGGPDPPTNLTAVSDYSFLAALNEDYKIEGMIKIWNDLYALQELGWA